MHIERLASQHFRNLAPLNIDSDAPIIVLTGDNGQGKTNLLEALYLCATGRSFRNATATQMCRYGAPHASVTARFLRQGVRHHVEISLRQGQRWIRVDDRVVRRSTALLQLLNTVAFFPDDLRIIKGSPEERRRFLDRAVANQDSAFVEATLAYHKALRARNALLRAPSPPDRALIEVYDSQLVRFGSVMQKSRQCTLSALVPAAQAHFHTFLPHVEGFSVELMSGVANGDSDDFAAGFAATLQQGYSRDRARGMTLCGPHRADMVCQIAYQDARTYASQGQQRALILALKLAEVVCLRAMLGASPILLLDDVSSELDAERTERLFDVVTQVQSQVWVSTTGAVPLPLPLPSTSQTWHVKNGLVTPLPAPLSARSARAGA